MELLIFSTFLFFALALMGYAFYNKKVIYLAAITSFLLMLLGASILTDGLTITYSGIDAVVFNDIYISAGGMFIVILGVMTLFLTFWYMLKGSEEEEE